MRSSKLGFSLKSKLCKLRTESKEESKEDVQPKVEEERKQDANQSGGKKEKEGKWGDLEIALLNCSRCEFRCKTKQQ